MDKDCREKNGNCGLYMVQLEFASLYLVSFGQGVLMIFFIQKLYALCIYTIMFSINKYFICGFCPSILS